MSAGTGGYLREALAACRTAFLWVLIAGIAVNALMLVSPIYMMQIFDRVLSSGRTETLIYLTMIAAFALLVLGILDAMRQQVLVRIGGWLDRTLGPKLIDSSVRGTVTGLAPSAQPLQDLAQVRGFIGGNGILALIDAPWTPIFIAVIWLMHPWLGMLAAAAAVFLFTLALINELATRGPLKRASEAQVEAQNEVVSALRNAELLQALGMLPALLARWRHSQGRSIDGQRAAGDRAATIIGTSKFTRLFVQVAILGLGAHLVLRAELTPGSMIAASILLGRCLAPVEQAIGAWKGFVTARTAQARLARLVAAVPAEPPRMELPPPEGRLQADGVVYTPGPGAPPILKRVSFYLAPGHSLGLIGPSGGGKSTLCRLLVGAALPTAGHVRLDGTEIHSWDRAQFGRHVGYLPQAVELFRATVRENIARLAEGDPDRVVAAARAAGADELIRRLPDGYETLIGDGQVRLSGGQRQRIGLARALYDDPRLLILDEPNANLDLEGEEALVTALAAAKARGATVVLVTHRPSLLSTIDTVMMLRDGAVELHGPRDEVLKKVTGPRLARPAQAG
ncbi:MAG: type I secretion system permease/ATPase [Inquilinus sp.]|nr:type I secretion system permease/ATPase [Inquilinus sp.]